MITDAKKKKKSIFIFYILCNFQLKHLKKNISIFSLVHKRDMRENADIEPVVSEKQKACTNMKINKSGGSRDPSTVMQA